MAVAIAGSMAVILMTWRGYADLYDSRLIHRAHVTPGTLTATARRNGMDLGLEGRRALVGGGGSGIGGGIATALARRARASRSSGARRTA